MSRQIRALGALDRARVADFVQHQWGSTRMATRGRLLQIPQLDGFVAEEDDRWLGHVAFEIVVQSMEIVLLVSLAKRTGVGSALLAACVRVARDADLRRIWLITTNDNTDALRFYQRLGFVLVALHRGAVDEARRTLKPEIPALGNNDIPIRDEMELELARGKWDDLIARYSWPSG